MLFVLPNSCYFRLVVFGRLVSRVVSGNDYSIDGVQVWFPTRTNLYVMSLVVYAWIWVLNVFQRISSVD